MDNTNNTSGQRVNTNVMSGPDILSQVSKEKFRRRLLIASRIIAVFLIIVLIFFTFIYLQVGKNIKEKPCWSCGYYYSKQCTPYVFNSLSTIPIADRRTWLAEFNEIPINKSLYNSQKYNEDLKDFNISIEQ
jgi:hypothetical protein